MNHGTFISVRPTYVVALYEKQPGQETIILKPANSQQIVAGVIFFFRCEIFFLDALKFKKSAKI